MTPRLQIERVPGPDGLDEEALDKQLAEDQERMSNFYDTVEYIEQDKDWEKHPELGEDEDDDENDPDGLMVRGAVFSAWDESKHPRHPKGSENGGEWISTASVAKMTRIGSDYTPLEAYARGGMDLKSVANLRKLIRAFGTKYIDPIEIKKDNSGRWTIVDGNHRAVAAIKEGARRIKVIKLEQQHDHAQQEDFAAIERNLDTLEDKAKQQLMEVIKEMREATANKLRKANNLQGFATELKLPYFGELRNAIRELMSKAHTMGLRNAQEGVRAHQTFASSFTPRAALKWLRDKEIVVAGVFSDGLTSAIKNLIVNALKTGGLGEPLIEAMYKLFEPYLGNPDILVDGVPPEPHRLNTMVRTITTEAYNHGRLTEYLDPDVLPFLVGVRYSAILDKRTTEVCRYLDGKVFKPNDPDLQGLIPPNHFNCRSIIVPIVVGQTVDASEFITPAQKGKAKGLADAKFLEQEEE